MGIQVTEVDAELKSPVLLKGYFAGCVGFFKELCWSAVGKSKTRLRLMRGGMHTDKHPFLCVNPVFIE